MPLQNTYTKNETLGATPNPVIPNPDAIDEAFIATANDILMNSAELVRKLIGAHQSAAAIVINKDWNYVRKYFSLSEKYAAWNNYNEPASGYGTHGWLLHFNKPVRFTDEELKSHPEWKNFGNQSATHPPMRGWMAAPIVDKDGKNWGLVQLSDKYEGDFTEEDEQYFIQFVQLISTALENAWELRNLRKG